MSLALLFHYLMLNMFRTLIHPSSGACDLFDELFHGLYCSGSMCVGVTLWFGWSSVVTRCRLVNGKSAPLQAWSDAEGSRKLRFPDYMTTAQDGGKVVSLTHRPPLPPGNTPGTHFC